MQDLFSFDNTSFIKKTDKLNPKGKKITLEEKQKTKCDTRDLNCKEILSQNGGFPKENEILAIKTNGTSDAGSFFSNAIDEFEVIDEMYLATWTISKANIQRLKQSIESGKLLKLVMVISSTLKPANPALYSSLILNLNHFDNVTIKEVNSHAKTYSFKVQNNHFTISGSANWSENPRIENYLILNSLPLYNHHKEWMEEL
jgi:hypothetical protein